MAMLALAPLLNTSSAYCQFYLIFLRRNHFESWFAHMSINTVAIMCFCDLGLISDPVIYPQERCAITAHMKIVQRSYEH